MRPENYNQVVYENKYTFGKTRDRYLYITRQKNYEPIGTPGKAPNTSSIDSLIDQDSKALLDQVVNTAFSIVYRLKIYNDITYRLDYNWFKIKNELLDLESSFYRGSNMNIARKTSMLTKELLQIDKQRFQEKTECWKDLSQPVNYFANQFHQLQELKQDQKMLKE